MGTSTSKPTPTGGEWSHVKREITRYSKGDNSTTTAKSIVSHIVRALSGQREGTGASGFISRTVTGGVARGAHFLESVNTTNLPTALEMLGITAAADLESMELIDRVSEAIIGGRLSFDEEIATTALRDSLIRILDYNPDDFEAAIRLFLQDKGLAGFEEAFLTRYVLEIAWGYIEDAARERILKETSIELLLNAIERLSSYEVGVVIQNSDFESVDWLGPQGRRLAENIAASISTDLANLA